MNINEQFQQILKDIENHDLAFHIVLNDAPNFPIAVIQETEESVMEKCLEGEACPYGAGDVHFEVRKGINKPSDMHDFESFEDAVFYALARQEHKPKQRV